MNFEELCKGGKTTINVLGTEYSVEFVPRNSDSCLADINNAYCDRTSKRLVSVTLDTLDSNLDYPIKFLKKNMRHEVIHAFLYESGIHENFEHPKYGHEETMIDWIAVQFPKILSIYNQLDCL